jgi:hypothetical protein
MDSGLSYTVHANSPDFYLFVIGGRLTFEFSYSVVDFQLFIPLKKVQIFEKLRVDTVGTFFGHSVRHSLSAEQVF